ncbi:hypothetical protein [Glutamicibacter ardleyensis]|uniref:hypothetical protein n=1 Tax=Glutamicibacter ardleyensis TaxID=225894 RepID=UPI003FD1A99A
MRADVGGMEIIRKKKTTFYRRYAWFAIIATPILVGILLIYILNTIGGADSVPTAEQTADSPTKATASNTITEWLNSTPAPLPGGNLASWDGVISSVEPEMVEDNTGEMVEEPGLETHQFTVRSKSGQLFHSTVQVTWTETLGATVVGAPSLEPLMRDNEATDVDMVEVWPGRALTPAPDGILPAVDVWLQAYISGDSNKIRLAMKDPNQEHSYFPLTQVAEAKIDRVTHFATNPDDPSQGLARVTAKVIWEGTPVDSTSQEYINSGATQMFDILLQDVDTASPTVLAWGGTGTGQELTPYKNAFVGRTLDLENKPFFSPEDVERRMKENIDAHNKASGDKGSAVAPKTKKD